ncbi:MAG TPA: diguanylate cyclase [Patescibacteria group bacterium]|nr:diguanylate cyclase [Patescibacteria group bacterium]
MSWFTRKRRPPTEPPVIASAPGRGSGPVDKDAHIRTLEARLEISEKERSRYALELSDKQTKILDLQRELTAFRTEHAGSPLMTLICKAFDRLQAAIMIAYTDGRLVYGNAAAEAMFGPVAGRQAHHLFLDDLRAPFKLRLEDTQVGRPPMPPGHELWDAVIAPDGGFVYDRVEIRSCDGEALDVALTMQLLEDQSGHPCFVLIETLDIGALSKDELTKLFRREVAIRVMTREIEFREKNKRAKADPLSVVFLDLDDFKSINSRYTEEGGNEVLRRVAKILQRCIRAESKDIACRWFSGDEFLAIVYGDHDTALRVADRVNEELHKLAIPFDVPGRGREDIRVTASIGVAEYELGDIHEDLVKRAIEGKSIAKSAGKGRVTRDLRPLDAAVVPFRPTESKAR